MKPHSILNVDHLCYQKKSFQIIKNVSFSIQKEGSIVGLLGRNGSGKSTIFKLLTGLLHQTSGSVNILGHNPQVYPGILHKMGVLIDTPYFHESLSGYDNLSYLLMLSPHISKHSRDRLIQETLARVGLTLDQERQKVKYYSLGMKQRLGLAQAFVHEPDLFLLDEPTNGLDKIGVIEFKKMILDLKHQGKTFILSTHVFEELEDLFTDVIFIDKGSLVWWGPISHIKGSLNDVFMQQLESKR